MTCKRAITAIISYQKYDKEERFTNKYEWSGYTTEHNTCDLGNFVGGTFTADDYYLAPDHRKEIDDCPLTAIWATYIDGPDNKITEKNAGTVDVNFVERVELGFCELQEEQQFKLEKPILSELTVEKKDNCINLLLDGNQIYSICSHPDCNPPKYQIECDPVECPDGTCCECRSGDYICCYNGQGVVIKRFRVK